MLDAGQRVALTVAYDGTNFAGFQLQAGLATVQSELETALARVLRSTVRVFCSGRTDAGVHSTGQVVSFAVPAAALKSADATVDRSALTNPGALADSVAPESPGAPAESATLADSVALASAGAPANTSAVRSPLTLQQQTERLQGALNALLPKTISVRGVHLVPSDFHARFSCVAREYVYLIQNAPAELPHWRGRAIWVRRLLPIDEINSELAQLLGERDWGSFTRQEYAAGATIRYVDLAKLEPLADPVGGPPLMALRIRGNAFLHNMIRILVGSIVDRAMGRLDLGLPEIMAARERTKAGSTAPAHGLYFQTAFYPESFRDCGLCTLPDYPTFRRSTELPLEKA